MYFERGRLLQGRRALVGGGGRGGLYSSVFVVDVDDVIYMPGGLLLWFGRVCDALAAELSLLAIGRGMLACVPVRVPR